MPDPLPVPAQLEAQLGKCKTVRSADTYVKDRTKSAQVGFRVQIEHDDFCCAVLCDVLCCVRWSAWLDVVSMGGRGEVKRWSRHYCRAVEWDILVQGLLVVEYKANKSTTHTHPTRTT